MSVKIVGVLGVLVLLSILTGCQSDSPPQACTADEKVCPDGSAVGRSGPDCEFAPCPGQLQRDSPSDCYTDCMYEPEVTDKICTDYCAN